ncbi:beta-hexosaminidase subunit alpha isoform X2 [Poeciliopsis prolifica]|uniref:beta-hexosaminidase subunit alpha isoform X2 n=2 Tax=Poeciliopsis prolifica TaxID=188132 RepID=UPI00241334A9|nr:beta-hexosaminidase subunit alpha isoform X2 [Poeciliopsis prolifica]
MKVMCSVNPGHCTLIKYIFLLLIIINLGLNTAESVWPLPQIFIPSSERYQLKPQSFSFGYRRYLDAKYSCSVLDAAFKRYFSILFPGYSYGNDTLQLSENEVFTLTISLDRHDCEGYPNQDSSEKYKLSVFAGQASLNAETVWGSLRGLETFSQLVYQDDFGSYYINKTEIEDYPQFNYRGILLDTSRHYLPVQAILKTLDAMAYSKFNVFHWHLVDDPSFPYQSHKFPDLSNKGAFHPVTHIYTQSDVRRVISYARMRGIRVLPEFDSPGHTQSWGKGQSELLTPCYRRGSPSGTFGPVNPTLPSTYQFMASLLKEVASVFPDSYIHLGGDEVDFSCWRSNPYIRAFMHKMGFGLDFSKLEAFYIEKIVNITSVLRKTSIVWQEVFDYHERHRFLSVVEVWKQGCYLCEVRSVVKAGLRVILASPWYLDQPGPTHNWARYYNVWPLAFKGTEKQKSLVIGGEVCLWGEYVDATNLSPRLWPRSSAAAERLWSNEKQTSCVERAFPRLQEFRCKLLRRGIQAEPLYVGHCKHEYQSV